LCVGFGALVFGAESLLSALIALSLYRFIALSLYRFIAWRNEFLQSVSMFLKLICISYSGLLTL